MQQLRLYFPLFQATQLVCGTNTSYAQEIRKLRQFGLSHITPHLRRTKLWKYPYKITIVYYTSTDTDTISALTITAYILHLFESNGVLQSNDLRVVPAVEVQMKKVERFSDEGCEIQVQKITQSQGQTHLASCP